MSRFRRLKQWLCSHEWKLSRFQALVGPWTYQCEKCGALRKESPNV